MRRVRNKLFRDTHSEMRSHNLSRRRLPLALAGNSLMRVAGGASAVLAGLYLADLANGGAAVNAELAGTLGATAFGAELVFSLPMGILADAVAPQWIVAGGAIAGAAATQLFGITASAGVFFLSRTIEGVGAAAVTPPLLAHISGVTHDDRPLRARTMSWFELSLLGGIAFGGVAGAQLWRALHTQAFAAVACLYLLCAALLFFGAPASPALGGDKALSGFRDAMRDDSLRRLAPAWFCMNTIVGLWLGPTLVFLLTHREHNGQLLAGIYASQPENIGWMLLGYCVIFGTGVTVWGLVLARMPAVRVLRIGVTAMFGVCAGLLVLNHAGSWPSLVRWSIGAATAGAIMAESGFTPAALSLLAGAVGGKTGRGAAMGIYSLLLSAGAIAGSLMAAELGKRFSVDGLILGTAAMAVVSLALLGRLSRESMRAGA